MQTAGCRPPARNTIMEGARGSWQSARWKHDRGGTTGSATANCGRSTGCGLNKGPAGEIDKRVVGDATVDGVGASGLVLELGWE